MSTIYDQAIREEIKANAPCCRNGIKRFGEANATGRSDDIVYCSCPKGVTEANKMPAWMNK